MKSSAPVCAVRDPSSGLFTEGSLRGVLPASGEGCWIGAAAGRVSGDAPRDDELMLSRRLKTVTAASLSSSVTPPGTIGSPSGSGICSASSSGAAPPSAASIGVIWTSGIGSTVGSALPSSGGWTSGSSACSSAAGRSACCVVICSPGGSITGTSGCASAAASVCATGTASAAAVVAAGVGTCGSAACAAGGATATCPSAGCTVGGAACRYTSAKGTRASRSRSMPVRHLSSGTEAGRVKSLRGCAAIAACASSAAAAGGSAAAWVAASRTSAAGVGAAAGGAVAEALPSCCCGGRGTSASGSVCISLLSLTSSCVGASRLRRIPPLSCKIKSAHPYQSPSLGVAIDNSCAVAPGNAASIRACRFRCTVCSVDDDELCSRV